MLFLIHLIRFRLYDTPFKSNEGNDDEANEDELRQRRYSLQLNESRGYRRGKKLSTQPQLDSEDELEPPTELLSRQNTF